MERSGGRPTKNITFEKIDMVPENLGTKVRQYTVVLFCAICMNRTLQALSERWNERGR